MNLDELDSISATLAESVSVVSFRGKAALFAACGDALAPLLHEVELRTVGRWLFPDVSEALDISEKYAVGTIVEGDYRHLRERLIASAPNGHELDSPWSTYAQDVLICLDAALVASSVSASEGVPFELDSVCAGTASDVTGVRNH
jgi:hypothetical protein